MVWVLPDPVTPSRVLIAVARLDGGGELLDCLGLIAGRGRKGRRV